MKHLLRLTDEQLDTLWNRLLRKKYDYSKGFIPFGFQDRIAAMQRKIDTYQSVLQMREIIRRMESNGY